MPTYGYKIVVQKFIMHSELNIVHSDEHKLQNDKRNGHNMVALASGKY